MNFAFSTESPNYCLHYKNNKQTKKIIKIKDTTHTHTHTINDLDHAAPSYIVFSLAREIRQPSKCMIPKCAQIIPVRHEMRL